MTERQEQPPPGPRRDDGGGPLEYTRQGAPPARRLALRGGFIAFLFSTLVLAVGVVFGAISAFEQPEKRRLILVSWAGALVIVLVVIGLARWRGTPGVVPGALIGIGLTALFAGWCYSAS